MKQEILITIKNEEEKIDIAVHPEMIVADLFNIIKTKMNISGTKKHFYSMNHKKVLESKNNLFQENIWDGDILRIIG